MSNDPIIGQINPAKDNAIFNHNKSDINYIQKRIINSQRNSQQSTTTNTQTTQQQKQRILNSMFLKRLACKTPAINEFQSEYLSELWKKSQEDILDTLSQLTFSQRDALVRQCTAMSFIPNEKLFFEGTQKPFVTSLQSDEAVELKNLNNELQEKNQRELDNSKDLARNAIHEHSEHCKSVYTLAGILAAYEGVHAVVFQSHSEGQPERIPSAVAGTVYALLGLIDASFKTASKQRELNKNKEKCLNNLKELNKKFYGAAKVSLDDELKSIKSDNDSISSENLEQQTNSNNNQKSLSPLSKIRHTDYFQKFNKAMILIYIFTLASWTGSVAMTSMKQNSQEV